MIIWLVGLVALVVGLHLLSVVAVAEFSVHPPPMRRVSDADVMVMQVARTFGAKATRVEVTAADGVPLSAWWIECAGEVCDAVLVCHGVTDTALRVMAPALMFLRHGYSVLAPDHRAHGRSGGLLTYGIDEAADIKAWQQWMVSRGAKRCFGYGESLGASCLLQALGAGARFNAVVGECPYSTFERVVWDRAMRVLKFVTPRLILRQVSDLWVAEMFFYLRMRYGVDFRLARPVDGARVADVPVLLIHGMEDLETPMHHSEEVGAVNEEFVRVWLVPGAGHTAAYSVDPEEWERRVLELMDGAG